MSYYNNYPQPHIGTPVPLQDYAAPPPQTVIISNQAGGQGAQGQPQNNHLQAEEIGRFAGCIASLCGCYVLDGCITGYCDDF